MGDSSRDIAREGPDPCYVESGKMRGRSGGVLNAGANHERGEDYVQERDNA